MLENILRRLDGGGMLAAVMSVLFAGSPSGNLQAEDLSAITIPEAHSVAITPEPDLNRLYVVDMVFPHPVAGRIYSVDGIKQDVLGTIFAGYMPGIVIAPDHKELMVMGTFWSRGANGDRTDVVTFYDPRKLEPTGEVILPNGRFLIADKKHNADITSDGKYLLVMNMTPATSVSVVDTVKREFAFNIETPGCMFVFPTGPKKFSSICANGAIYTASFDSAGKVKASRSKAFFDVVKDPVFEHVGFDRDEQAAHFISYEGLVHSVDLSGDAPVFAEPWSVTSDAERKEKWKPGGWELTAFDQKKDYLYVLMHQGGDWTHKQPGTEVWVFDVNSKKRVQRIVLDAPAMSIVTSQDSKAPRLYAIKGSELRTYDLNDGKLVGTIKQMGDTVLELIAYDR